MQDGEVWIGHRHHNIIHGIVKAGGKKPVTGTQGFWSEHGWFLDREDALETAIEHGQVAKGKLIPNMNCSAKTFGNLVNST